MLICECHESRQRGKQMNIAEKLRDARGSRARKDVAKAVGISLSALAMYESGYRVPRDEIKVRLANLYGKTVGEIFF